MPQFFKALTGSFIGRVLGALFVAICFALGFGPDKWAIFMIQNLPIWFTPSVAQVSFVVLGVVSFLVVFRPWMALSSRSGSPNIKVEISSRWLDQDAQKASIKMQKELAEKYHTNSGMLLRYHSRIHILNCSTDRRVSLQFAAYNSGNSTILGGRLGIRTEGLELNLGPEEETEGTFTVDLDEHSAQSEQSLFIIERLTGTRALVRVPGKYPPGLPLPETSLIQRMKNIFARFRLQPKLDAQIIQDPPMGIIDPSLGIIDSTASSPAVNSLPPPIYLVSNSPKPQLKLSAIELSKDEKIWLEQAYQAFLAGKIMKPHELKRTVGVSADFDPKKFDRRLITEQNTITLLGIWHLHPDTDWGVKTQVVLKYIQQIIRADIKTDNLKIADLADKLSMSDHEVSTAINLAQSIGLSWAIAGGSGNWKDTDYPWSYESVRVAREETFAFYDKFEGIEEPMWDFAEKKMNVRFNHLLHAMLTKAPKPAGKTAAKPRSSSEGVSADYTGTRTRGGKSASASSKPKRKSRKSTASRSPKKPR